MSSPDSVAVGVDDDMTVDTVEAGRDSPAVHDLEVHVSLSLRLTLRGQVLMLKRKMGCSRLKTKKV